MENEVIKAYKRIFGEILEPYGFRLLKGTKFFVKVVNDEIVQSVYIFKSRDGSLKFAINHKTIYSNLYLGKSKGDCLLLNYSEIFQFSDVDMKTMFWDYDESNMKKVIEQAAMAMVKYVLPKFDQVLTTKDCIPLYKKYFIDKLREEPKDTTEFLLLIRERNRDDFEDVVTEALKETQKLIEKGRFGETYENAEISLREAIIDAIVVPRDEMLNNPKKLAEADAEIERRAKVNREVLRMWGF